MDSTAKKALWSDFLGAVRNTLDQGDIGEWDEFVGACDTRFQAGAEEYGDASYRRRFLELGHEVMEEQIDQPVWASIIWARLTHERDLPEGIAEDTRARLVRASVRAFRAWKDMRDLLEQLSVLDKCKAGAT